MKNSWLIWIFITGVVITVLVAFNYDGGKNTVPLSEIFPETSGESVDIDYEFVDSSQEAQEQNEQTIQIVSEKIDDAKVEETVKELASVTSEIAKSVSKPVEQNQDKDSGTFEAIPFTIQVASFKERSRAQKIVDELKEKEHSAFIVSKDLGSKGVWYRVYVGEFQTKTQAQSKLLDIQKSYKSSFIISPKKKS